MPRRLPSDAVLLVLALAAVALVIGTTFVLHHVFVGDDVVPVGVADAHVAGDTSR
jgi:hypothetical protein